MKKEQRAAAFISQDELALISKMLLLVMGQSLGLDQACFRMYTRIFLCKANGRKKCYQDLLGYAKKQSAKSYDVPLKRVVGSGAAQAKKPPNLGRMGCLCQLLSPKGNMIGFCTLLFCIPQ